MMRRTILKKKYHAEYSENDTYICVVSLREVPINTPPTRANIPREIQE